MPLLSDLDGAAWSVTLAAVTICVTIAIADIRSYRNRWLVRARRKSLLLWLGALVCSAMAIDTITQASSSPHGVADGGVELLRAIPGGRGSGSWLVCVPACRDGAPALLLDSRGIAILRQHKSWEELRFGYLEDWTECLPGVQCHKIVDIDDTATGVSHYHRDTRHHPFRAIALLADALLCFLTGLLARQLAVPAPEAEDAYEDYPETEQEPEPGPLLTSLDLERQPQESSPHQQHHAATVDEDELIALGLDRRER